jgi:FKBP-type peptidyl-prolyl cis-trans isomerase FkpA
MMMAPRINPRSPRVHFPRFAQALAAAFASIVLMPPVAAQTDTAAAAAKEPGASLSASGLVYRSLKEGSGASPKASDVVKVHYRGTFPDGKEFDSSIARGTPAEFPLGGVIKCWTEGVQMMKVGGKARLTCPPAIAYGERGAGRVIPPNATLHFEVELLGIAGKWVALPRPPAQRISPPRSARAESPGAHSASSACSCPKSTRRARAHDCNAVSA